jgi:hypothetical protein
MASVRVNMRVPGDLWAAVSKYAEERESNNTAVVVGALRSFLDDAGRGVPELEEAPGDGREAVAASRPSPGSSPPTSPRVPDFSPARQLPSVSAPVRVRFSAESVSAVTGHREGCGCARCDDVRTGRRG